ncbi:MAG: 2-methylthioadenine synthetase, partial [Desulfurococcaceae archaeon]
MLQGLTTMPLKVYIETYGCALNKSDEALMINSLESRGHKLVSTPDEADAIIINTCTVRLDTEYKMLSRIKQLRGLCVKSGKKLVVAGCMAKIQPYTISLIAPEASLISPQNSDKAYMAVEARDRVLL